MPGLEDLNAYVDGELPPDRAAEVARAVAGDARVARQVATLSHLRSALREAGPVADLALPEMRRPRSRAPRWLAAACAAGLVLAGGWLALNRPWVAPRDDWLATAWDLHGDWSAPLDSAGADEGGAGALRALAARAGPDSGFVPDLSSAKLRLRFAETRPYLSGAPALVAGYRGTRGCKVTLLVASARVPLGTLPRLYAEDAKLAYAWRQGTRDYLLLSEGMDADRFRLIADSVYRASMEHRPFDRETRTALRDSRDKSKPCLA